MSKTKRPDSEPQRRDLDLSALFEISQTLNRSLDLQTVYNLALLMPMGRMMIGRSLIVLRSAAEEYEIKQVKGLPLPLLGQRIKIDAPFREPLLLTDDPAAEKWRQFFKEQQIRLLIPLLSAGQLKGILGFGARLNQQEFSRSDREFLTSLGNIVIQAIENAASLQEIKQVNDQLDRKIQQLNALFDIGQELNQIYDRTEVLNRLAYVLMGQLMVNQFFILLKQDSKLEVAFHKGSQFSSERLSACMDTCESLTEAEEARQVTAHGPLAALFDIGVRAIIPMQLQQRIGGFLLLGARLNRTEYQETDLEFISTLANMAMISLENVRLIQVMLEKERMEEELRLARTIQNRLLPEEMPNLDSYDIHGLNLPSKQVGGDYFDIIPLSDQEYLFAIADVSGKGMPAALLMSNLQAALHSLIMADYELHELTARLNTLIHHNTSIEKFITFFVLKLHLPTGDFQYVNAGHNPPYVFSPSGSYQELTIGGLLLGVIPNEKFELGSGRLEPGSCLSMFTDGVTEAMNSAEQEFKEARVIRFFQQETQASDSKTLNTKLIEQLRRFSGGDPTQNDDVTLLTIRRIK